MFVNFDNFSYLIFESKCPYPKNIPAGGGGYPNFVKPKNIPGDKMS